MGKIRRKRSFDSDFGTRRWTDESDLVGMQKDARRGTGRGSVKFISRYRVTYASQVNADLMRASSADSYF